MLFGSKQKNHVKVIQAGALALAALAFGCGASAGRMYAADLSAEINIDVQRSLGPVNPLIFGHNIEAADSAGIFGPTRPEKILTGDGFWEPKNSRPSPLLIQRAQEIGTRMLRYPGGCLAHNFDWRKAVGPKESRPNWPFGVQEYLQVCHELGAEPLITMSDYVLPAEEMPQHLADFVEFLNAPAEAKYPWAMKRKEWGHAEPYGVVWFELGNESNHGNHDTLPRRLYTPAAYAEYAKASIRAMKAVDPKIKISIVTEAGGTPESQWNRVVIKEAGPYADFLTVHMYPGGMGGRPLTLEREKEAMLSCMASAEVSETTLARYRATMKQYMGKVLPISLSEYNNALHGDKPKAYRYSLGGALVAADVLRLALRLENDIVTANHWQIFNGYFGSIRVSGLSRGADYTSTELAAYWCYRLWGQHFGAELLDAVVRSPKEMTFAGQALAASGKPVPEESRLTLPEKITDIPVTGLHTKDFTKDSAQATIAADGTLQIRLKNFTGNGYPNVALIKRPANAEAGCDYRFTFEARYQPEPGSEMGSLGMGLGDSRGWDATQSAISIAGIDSNSWHAMYGELVALPDAPGVIILVRLEPGSQKMSGLLEIRNMHMEAYSKRVLPKYDVVTATASLSKDKKKLYVIAFNKSLDHPVQTTLRVNGFNAASARRWEVNGPAIESIDGVKETRSGENIEIHGGSIGIVLPAHSMTAIEIEP